MPGSRREISLSDKFSLSEEKESETSNIPQYRSPKLSKFEGKNQLS